MSKEKAKIKKKQRITGNIQQDIDLLEQAAFQAALKVEEDPAYIPLAIALLVAHKQDTYGPAALMKSVQEKFNSF